MPTLEVLHSKKADIPGTNAGFLGGSSGLKSSFTRSLLVAGAAAGAAWAARTFVTSAPRITTSFAGKVILITGGSRGFGLALAEEFGRQGARIAICARDPNELSRAESSLREKGVDAQSFTADLSIQAEVHKLVDAVASHFGGIDALINNAGEITVGPFASIGVDAFESALKSMFWAPLYLAYAALPHMRTKGSGTVVNIASVGGLVSLPHLLPYSCAKFALVGFSEGLAAELQSEGIHVLTVCPGLMRTGSYLKAKFSGQSRREFDWFSLLGNLPGLSTAASAAAQEVRRSLQRGESRCVISIPAKLLAALHDIDGELTHDLLAFAHRLILPKAQAGPPLAGERLTSAENPLLKAFTALGKVAAKRWNEA